MLRPMGGMHWGAQRPCMHALGGFTGCLGRVGPAQAVGIGGEAHNGSIPLPTQLLVLPNTSGRLGLGGASSGEAGQSGCGKHR